MSSFSMPQSVVLTMGDQLPPPTPTANRAQIIVVLSEDASRFDQREREGLRRLVARFASLSLTDITIAHVDAESAAGSVRVTLELPESTARWLRSLYQRNKPLIELLDIQAIHSLRVLQPEPTPKPMPPPARVAQRPSISWQRIAIPVLALATALLLVLCLIQQREISAAVRNNAIVLAAFGNDDKQEQQFTETNLAPDAAGKIWLSPSASAVALYLKKLPPLPQGQVYQLWLDQNGQIINVGTFEVNQEGRAWKVFQPEQLKSPVQRVFVTLEPAGGSPQPTGLEVLQESVSAPKTG